MRKKSTRVEGWWEAGPSCSIHVLSRGREGEGEGPTHRGGRAWAWRALGATCPQQWTQCGGACSGAAQRQLGGQRRTRRSFGLARGARGVESAAGYACQSAEGGGQTNGAQIHKGGGDRATMAHTRQFLSKTGHEGCTLNHAMGGTYRPQALGEGPKARDGQQPRLG